MRFGPTVGGTTVEKDQRLRDRRVLEIWGAASRSEVLLGPFGAAVRGSEFSRGLVAAAGWVRGVCGRPSGDAHPFIRAVSPI